MLKKLFLLVITLPLISIAAKVSPAASTKSVFSCQSASQNFEIKQDPRTKELKAILSSPSAAQKRETMSCKEKDSNYVCKKNDYIATVQTGASGRRIVQVQLAGDFDIEEGHLYTIYCKDEKPLTTPSPASSQVQVDNY